jgi:hypothetical protein
MSFLDQLAKKIIREQELVVGPIAWIEAGKVSGLNIIDTQKGDVELKNGDPKDVIDRLVNQYEHLFGRASHEVCREAVASMIAGLPQADVPMSLRS